MNYYVLFVKGKEEVRVCEFLNAYCSDWDVSFPLMEKFYRRKGLDEIVRCPLFPCYVFVRTKMDAFEFHRVLFSGEPISMIAMMGFLVLAGVVVNNGIVFVDYVNQLRIAGREKKQALIETGKARIRPILMTALTTILAMSTMAFSKEVSAEMSKGMAIVTIGGLVYATLMTLFIVPVLYDILFRRKLNLVDIEEDGTAEHENIVLEIDSSANEK